MNRERYTALLVVGAIVLLTISTRLTLWNTAWIRPAIPRSPSRTVNEALGTVVAVCPQWPPAWRPAVPFCSKEPTRYFCTPSQYTWIDFERPFVNGTTWCRELVRRNITRVKFFGDSFIRHVYQATLLILSGNYKNGSMKNASGDCADDMQFRKECNEYIPTEVEMCHGSIRLGASLGPYPSPQPNDYDAIVLGVGNWPFQQSRAANGNFIDTKSQRNATATINNYLKPICEARVAHKDNRPLIWLSFHASIFYWQGKDRVLLFNNGTVPYVRDYCEGGRTIDTFTFTEALVTDRPMDASNMTRDKGNHWTRAVNLIKAQRVLYAMTNFDPEPGDAETAC